MAFSWIPLASAILILFLGFSSASDICGEGIYCQSSQGGLQYCPYKDGICCGDGQHCCPKGTVCDIGKESCRVLNEESFSLTNLIQCPEKPNSRDEFSLVHLRKPSDTKSPVLCPDRQSACPEGTTCCQMDGDSWGCCDHPNAVCCADHSHCCPQGYRCDVTQAACIPENRISNVLAMFLAMLNRLPVLRQAQSVDSTVPQLSRSYEICKDKRHRCPVDTTCCPAQDGSYACCPMPDAVCCSDGLHCCPKDTVCDMASGQCLGSSAAYGGAVPMVASKRSSSALVQNNETACPDAQYSCSKDQTCCQLKSGEWGCCPVPQAVCCPDQEHCCPLGFRCDIDRGMCVRLTTNVTTVRRVTVGQACPNPEWECDDNSTCCQLGNDEWGCCDMPNAVCCEDKAHCCPANHTCDVQNDRCVRSDAASVFLTGIQAPVKKLRCTSDGFHCPEHTRCDPKTGDCVPDTRGQMLWFRKMPAKYTQSVAPAEPGSITCPGDKWQCPNNNTCCQAEGGIWACCPIPNAVCCADQQHCCPSGSRCVDEVGMCIMDESSEKIQATRTGPRPSVPLGEDNVKSNADPVVCPGGQLECPWNSTCCHMNAGSWGCCPSKDAVCCPDGLHCCPKDYTCSPVDSSCVRLPPSEPAAATVAAPSPTDTVCPDKRSYCIDHQSCCPLIDGDFGCCPLVNGTCCEDRAHCCPEGTVCAKEPGECVRPSANGLRSSRVQARRMTPVPQVESPLDTALLGFLRRTALPGQVVRTGWCSECQDKGFCCPDAQGQHNRMCCDKAGSMCCEDGNYCCPPGTKCAGNGQCDQITEDRFLAPFLIPSKRLGSVGKTQNRAVQSTKGRPTWKDPRLLLSYYRRYKSARWTICPDNHSACHLDEQCCQSADHGYVCAPNTATCCSVVSDSYCPAGSQCSVNGALCHLTDGA